MNAQRFHSARRPTGGVESMRVAIVALSVWTAACHQVEVRLADGTLSRAPRKRIRTGQHRALSDAQVALERSGFQCELFYPESVKQLVRCSHDSRHYAITYQANRQGGGGKLSVQMNMDLMKLPCSELEWRRDHRPSRSQTEGFCMRHGETWAYQHSVTVPQGGTPSGPVVEAIDHFGRNAVDNYTAIMRYPEGDSAPTSTP